MATFRTRGLSLPILLLGALMLGACGSTGTFKQTTIETPGGPETVQVGVTEKAPPPVVHYDAQGKAIPTPPAPPRQFVDVPHQIYLNGGYTTVYTQK